MHNAIRLNEDGTLSQLILNESEIKGMKRFPIFKNVDLGYYPNDDDENEKIIFYDIITDYYFHNRYEVKIKKSVYIFSYKNGLLDLDDKNIKYFLQILLKGYTNATDRTDYKRFKHQLGSSDISTLIAVGPQEKELGVKAIDFVEDNFYVGYLINNTQEFGKKIKIPEGYKKVFSSKYWLKLYDDEKLVFNKYCESNQEINIYTERLYDIIIEITEIGEELWEK